MYYKPTPFRADVREIAHGLIIRTIQHLKLKGALNLLIFMSYAAQLVARSL